QADDGRADREARQDHRDADAVARLVARIPVLGAVVFEEPGPLSVQLECHGRILVEVDGVGETPEEARAAPVGACRPAPGPGRARIVPCFGLWSRLLAGTRGSQLASPVRISAVCPARQPVCPLEMRTLSKDVAHVARPRPRATVSRRS